MPRTFVNATFRIEESTPLLVSERNSDTYRYTTASPTSASANRTSNWVIGHFSERATPFDNATAPPPCTSASVRSNGQLHRFGSPHYSHPYRNATAPSLTVVESQRSGGHCRSGHAGNFTSTQHRSFTLPAFESGVHESNGPDELLCPEVAELADRVGGTFGSSIEVAIFHLCVIGGVVVLALLVLGLCYVAVLAGIEIAGSIGAVGLSAYIAFIGLVIACWACACLVATTDD